MNVLAYQYPAKILQSSYRSVKSKSLADNKLKIVVQFEEKKVVLDTTPHSRPSEIIRATLGKVSIQTMLEFLELTIKMLFDTIFKMYETTTLVY